MIDVDEQLESAIALPTVDPKIGVERQDTSSTELIGEVDQARIGQIHRHARVLLQQLAYRTTADAQPDRNVEDANLDVFEHGVRSSAKSPQQPAGFRDDRFTSHECAIEVSDDFYALFVMAFTSVEKRYDTPRVQ